MAESELPDLRIVMMEGDGELAFRSDWMAAETMVGEYVVALVDTVKDGSNGRGAAIIAKCPSFPIATYIAHMHNLLKPDLMKQVDRLMGRAPAGSPAEPEETGGYL